MGIVNERWRLDNIHRHATIRYTAGSELPRFSIPKQKQHPTGAESTNSSPPGSQLLQDVISQVKQRQSGAESQKSFLPRSQLNPLALFSPEKNMPDEKRLVRLLMGVKK